MSEQASATSRYEPLPPTPECEQHAYCPMTKNGAYHGICLWHEGAERTCTCNGRVNHAEQAPAWPETRCRRCLEWNKGDPWYCPRCGKETTLTPHDGGTLGDAAEWTREPSKNTDSASPS